MEETLTVLPSTINTEALLKLMQAWLTKSEKAEAKAFKAKNFPSFIKWNHEVSMLNMCIAELQLTIANHGDKEAS